MPSIEHTYGRGDSIGFSEDATPAYPHQWANILIAPLSEGAVATYLEALVGPITSRYVPSPMIVQSLLYLTIYPPSPPLPAHVPTPLSILYKIASLHSTSSLMAHHTIPTHARRKVDQPAWLWWEANGDVERNIKRRMRKCEKEGIWTLIWEDSSASGASTSTSTVVSKSTSTRRKRRRGRFYDDEDEGEEEEEFGEKQGRVSERGWILLEWLVHIWENDQKVHGSYSPAFLAQLPKLEDMQIDNPSLPLRVVSSLINDSHTTSTSLFGEEQKRRKETTSRLISLLINTAQGLNPPFHSTTLTLSLLPLFRTPPRQLETFLSLFSDIEEGVNGPLSHFLIHAIEDLVGIRSLKSIERRNRENRDFVRVQGGRDNFPRPTIGYCLDILLLHMTSSGSDGEESKSENEVNEVEHEMREKRERLAILKTVLVATVLQITTSTPDDNDDINYNNDNDDEKNDHDIHKDEGGWARSSDTAWRAKFDMSMKGNGIEGMRVVILRMLDRRTT